MMSELSAGYGLYLRDQVVALSVIQKMRIRVDGLEADNEL